MKYLFLAGLVGAFGVVAACGGDDHATPLPGSGATGAGGKAAGVSGKSSGGSSTNTMGGEGLGGTASGDGLNVTIVAPTAAKDPNVDEVVTTEDVTVVCSIVPGDSSLMVDGSTVLIEVLDADGEPAVGQDAKPLSAVGAPTKNDNEYSAEFPLTTVDTGVVSFRCSAETVDNSESGTATVSTFVDHGPKITVIEPKLNSAHQLIGVMPVEFTVEPAPLTDDDEGAAVTAVNLEVAGVAITDLTEDPAGHYTAQIDFTDKTLFKDVPPEHTTVHVDATNSRMPAPVKAIEDDPIVVDGREPVITYTFPADNAAVHGDTKVTFTIEDTGAGVDVDTLEVSVTGQDTVKYDVDNKAVWGRNGSTFSFHFNASGLKDVISQVTIATRVKDLAGNGDDKGETLLVYKDDQPPTIDLDPGMGRVYDPNREECSEVFDPLGVAANDGGTVSSSAARFRVLIYDQTNDDGGPQYFAGTNQATATLYLQPDPTKDFLIDKTGDGVCDDIANADALPYQSLLPVKPGGTYDGNSDDILTPPVVFGCTPAHPGMAPDHLCADNGSDLTYVVKHPVAGGGIEPVVFAMGGLKEPECTGSLWLMHSVTSKLVDGKSVSLSPDGWICLAARAEDKLQNQGVSRPLRVCYDDPLVDGVPACATGAPAPSCTKNCTAPARMPPTMYY